MPPLNERLKTPPGAISSLVSFARLARRPIELFLRVEAASGIVLLLAALVAIGLANSPWSEPYAAFWHTPFGVRMGPMSFERPLEWIVNDGLMVIFFFVVGLEIRREIHAGELSELRRAALPVVAALGGMVAPALIYLGFAGAPDTRSGWGVPMATDIAFAVGVIALLGKRVPAALHVLLLALAVIDDLGAIVVIALFYSAGIVVSGLLWAAFGIAAIYAMQAFGVRTKLAYVVPGVVIWAGVYAAGIHPTIAGVVIGLITPVEAWLGAEGFVQDTRQQLDALSEQDAGSETSALVVALSEVDFARREAISPAESLIASLHPWVAFGIMPVFALANAGVSLRHLDLDAHSSLVAFGIASGLILGKPLGILAASAISLRLGIARLPAGIGYRELLVLGVIAGIGFTMALFVAQLAFADLQLLAAAKLAVLVGSAAAGMLGLGLGRWLLPSTVCPEAARTVEEAEASTAR